MDTTFSSPHLTTNPIPRWAGRLLTGIPAAFLTVDAAMKLVGHPAVAQASEQLGIPGSLTRIIGLVLATCLALYLVPRTAPLGAVLLTGYLGGAVFVHLRVGDPLFSHTLFPVYFGALLWAGLFLRRPARAPAALFPLTLDPKETQMKFLLTYQQNPDAKPPTPAQMAAIGAYTKKNLESGVVVLTGGLVRPTRGIQISCDAGKVSVTDGPFAETKELIDGFALVEVKSKQEAIALASEFMQLAGDGKGEILQVFDPGGVPPR